MSNDALKSTDTSHEVVIDELIAHSHPLRSLKAAADEIIIKIGGNREDYRIQLDQFLRAMLLYVLYSIRSDRELLEQVRYNLLYRWFIGLKPDDASWDLRTFEQYSNALHFQGSLDYFFKMIFNVPEWRKLSSDLSFIPNTKFINAVIHNRPEQPDNRHFISLQGAVYWVSSSKNCTVPEAAFFLKQLNAHNLQGYDCTNGSYSPTASWRGINQNIANMLDHAIESTGRNIFPLTSNQNDAWFVREFLELLNEHGCRLDKEAARASWFHFGNGLPIADIQNILNEYQHHVNEKIVDKLTDQAIFGAGNLSTNEDSADPNSNNNTRLDEESPAPKQPQEGEHSSTRAPGRYLSEILSKYRGLDLLYEFIELSEGVTVFEGKKIRGKNNQAWAFVKYCHMNGFQIISEPDPEKFVTWNEENKALVAPHRMAEGTINLLFHNGKPNKQGNTVKNKDYEE